MSDVRKYGLRVAVHNARFNLGYRIGGFTHAVRSEID